MEKSALFKSFAELLENKLLLDLKLHVLAYRKSSHLDNVEQFHILYPLCFAPLIIYYFI